MKDEAAATAMMRSVDRELRKEIEDGKYPDHGCPTGIPPGPGTISSQSARFCEIVRGHADRVAGTLLDDVLKNPAARADLVSFV